MKIIRLCQTIKCGMWEVVRGDTSQKKGVCVWFVTCKLAILYNYACI